jgi:hypothetical protein
MRKKKACKPCLLRRELSARNAAYAASKQVPHVTSYGEMPVFVYQVSPCGQKHGNFISASYKAILRRPKWKRRFDKVHSSADRALPKNDDIWKELDSSMSSDALLMNIFCYKGEGDHPDLWGFGDGKRAFAHSHARRLFGALSLGLKGTRTS